MIVGIHPPTNHTAILLKASPKGEGVHPSPNETQAPGPERLPNESNERNLQSLIRRSTPSGMQWSEHRAMEPEPQQSHGNPDQSRFGGFHIWTFEAELLISGAVVFGLLQVAPHITRFFDNALVRLEGHLRVLANLGVGYSR